MRKRTTSFAKKSLSPPNRRPLHFARLSARTLNQKTSPQSFVQGYDRVFFFKCSSHSSSLVCLLPKIFSLRAGSQNSSPMSLAASMAPRAFAFLTFTRLFGSCSLAHFSVVLVRILPVAAFNSFVNYLAEGMPLSVNQGRSPSVFLNVVNVDAGLLCSSFASSQC